MFMLLTRDWYLSTSLQIQMSPHSRYEPRNSFSELKEYHMNLSKELSSFDFKNFELFIDLRNWKI